MPRAAPTAPTKRRMPTPPTLRYSSAYVTSASHDCATHGVPAAVYENTSWCGIPWSRMYSPVRRCQKNELSERLEIPTAQPKSPNTAENTTPSPRPRRVTIGSWTTCTGARAGPRTVAGARVGVAVTASERTRDLDERRADDHDEDRREDAEHQWEQHLHRRLLCELLRLQASTDAHVVGLRPEQARDGHPEGVGLEHREDE